MPLFGDHGHRVRNGDLSFPDLRRLDSRRTESYTLVLVTFSIIFGLCALIFAVLRPPPAP